MCSHSQANLIKWIPCFGPVTPPSSGGEEAPQAWSGQQIDMQAKHCLHNLSGSCEIASQSGDWGLLLNNRVL